MKLKKPLRALLVSAAFVAATLQGSRLPETTPGADVLLAQVAAENRSGSGTDQGDMPPLRDGVIA